MNFWNTAQVQAAAVVGKPHFAKLIQTPLGEMQEPLHSHKKKKISIVRTEGSMYILPDQRDFCKENQTLS